MEKGLISTARDRLKAAQHVQGLLPRFSEEADLVFRDLRKRCAAVQKMREKIAETRALFIRGDKLQRRIAVEQKLLSGVVPASVTYSELHSRFQASIDELQAMK